MSKLQKLEFETKNMQERVKRDMSEYSENLRRRLAHISNYRQEFENAYNGFVEADIPRDELYLRLEAEADRERERKRAHKEGKTNIIGNPMVLPKVQTDAERVQERLHRVHGAQLLALIEEDEAREQAKNPLAVKPSQEPV